ncbi:MAG: trypsin-like peptidase domain-containing protein [Acidobacteria bacterium]|nr:trypsin-like peptidase domain-containing protein [Acidobacteriota bacterium]
MVRRVLLACVLGLAARLVIAVQIDSLLLPDEPLQRAGLPALRLAEAVAVAPLASLRPANVGAVDQLDGIAAWNRSGAVPERNGFARPLPLPKSVRFTADLLKSQPGRLAGGALLVPPSGGLVWGAEVRVEDSHRLRLHLSKVDLPKGARLWVYGEGTEEVSVAAEDVTFQGELWTPSVAGPAIRLEVGLPEEGIDGSRFVIDQVLESFELKADGSPRLAGESKEDLSCLQDAACFDNSALPIMDLYKRAVARLEFVNGGQGFLCSGGLLNDADTSTVIPYLLTANHCLSTQATASTLEAFFDYIDDGCHGAAPSLGSVPRTNGATLLATGEGSDFTLVRLSSLPAGRGLLGSTSETIANGTELKRLSHPQGMPMAYSLTTVTGSGPHCDLRPRPNYLYSSHTFGGIFGGSSGSPVVRASDGKVVGQLLGECGTASSSGCDAVTSVLDGALSQTWPSISSFLTSPPPPPPPPVVCTPTSTALCLNGDRFKVEATFNTGTQHGRARVVKLTDETGYLWFFSNTNVEVVVKVLNACTLNQRFWVFAAGLTNVQVTLTVTDTSNGTVKTYDNPQGAAFQPILDSSAFATCP